MAITRRTFFQRAMLGACALPGWTSFELLPPERLEIEQVIFDARRSDALVFGEAARRLDTSTHALCGDISDRQYYDLFLNVQRRRRAVAGLTDFRSLFFLQAMAADAGLYPVLRIHHGSRADGCTHEAFGMHAYRAVCNSRLASCAGCWAHEAACLALTAPALGPSAAGGDNLREANSRVLASGALVTWVMA
jgi:hypothetical protein